MKSFKVKMFSLMGFGIIAIILSIIGIVVFMKTGWYFIHPMQYLLIAVCGLGWVVTAIVSYFDVKKFTNNIKIK